MSRYKRDVSLEEAGDLQRERVVFKYSERYGQHPETEAKYREAIQAIQDMNLLSLSINDIARMYNVPSEAFRNQLKRHFPDVLARRRQLRIMLGHEADGRYGLQKSTEKKYARAVEMLRDASLTVREVAQRCGVSYCGLQQHLLFYHKDIADARMLTRADALMRPLQVGDYNAVGGLRVPRPEAAAKYAPAVELYRATNRTVVDIADICGVDSHNLHCYLLKWHRDLVLQRRERAEKLREAKKLVPKMDRSRSAVARQLYMPSIELITSGYTLAEAAGALGVDVENLRSWLKNHYPVILETVREGMMRLPSGRMVLRRTYYRYEPIAGYIKTHPSKPTRAVAEKWDVPVSSLVKNMKHYFPEVWELHCKHSGFHGKSSGK